MTAKPNPIPDDFKPFTGFPTRENCDPTNPYEAFLWMLVALPYQKGGQLVMPVAYLQFVSKRLWDCGVRPVEEPVIKYQKPLNTDANWLSSPGTWVDVGAPERDSRRPVEKAVDNLLPAQQAEVVEEIWGRMSPEQRRMMIERNKDGGEG